MLINFVFGPPPPFNTTSRQLIYCEMAHTYSTRGILYARLRYAGARTTQALPGLMCPIYISQASAVSIVALLLSA